MPFFFSSDKGRPCGGSKLREARQEWKVFAKRKAQPPYEGNGGNTSSVCLRQPPSPQGEGFGGAMWASPPYEVRKQVARPYSCRLFMPPAGNFPYRRKVTKGRPGGCDPLAPKGIKRTLRFYWRAPASGDGPAACFTTPPAAEEDITRCNPGGAEQAPKSSSVLSGKRGKHTQV